MKPCCPARSPNSQPENAPKNLDPVLVAEKDDYLLDLLVDLGFTSAEVVAQAREEAQAAGVGVVDYLVANKAIRPGDVTQAKAAQFGAEVVNLANLKIEDDVISTVSRDV